MYRIPTRRVEVYGARPLDCYPYPKAVELMSHSRVLYQTEADSSYNHGLYRLCNVLESCIQVVKDATTKLIPAKRKKS